MPDTYNDIFEKWSEYNTVKTKDDIGTLCDTCKFGSSCKWAIHGRPIPGWVAEETVIHNCDSDLDGYRVIECPQYETDARCIVVSDKAVAKHKYKPWTDDDIKVVITNYGRVDTGIIAEALDRSVSSISDMAVKLRRMGHMVPRLKSGPRK